MKMTNVSSSMSELILDALLVAQEKDKKEVMEEEDRAQYQLNPADVIKEEELEESMGDQSFRKMAGFSNLSNSNIRNSPGEIVDIIVPITGQKKDEVESLLKEEGMET